MASQSSERMRSLMSQLPYLELLPATYVHASSSFRHCSIMARCSQEWEYAYWGQHPPATQSACFNLLKANMKAIHQASLWVWRYR